MLGVFIARAYHRRAMFELVFLGTAAAAPSAERGSPSLVVAAGPDRLLVDCGEGTQRQMMRAGIGFRGLRQVLLTHAHLDHIAGLAGLIATRALFGIDQPVEIVGSGETVAIVRGYLEATVGRERNGAYRLRAVTPGLVLTRAGWRLDAFAVAHRGTESLGWIFRGAARRPLLADRLTTLGVPSGPDRRALAAGAEVTLADGRRVTPEMVRGPEAAGAKLVVVGDAEETEALVEPVRGADALVIEATFLDRDAALARPRGHLTAAAAARLAQEAAVGRLLLTHISGRYPANEIAAEAVRVFPAVCVAADFDRIRVNAR
jgi:ribonuclease Z